MARQRLRIGERGEITTRKIEDKKWLASCLYRDSWGKRRTLPARAATKGAATNALKNKWHALSVKIVTREEASTVKTFDRVAAEYFENMKNDRSKNRPLPRTVFNTESRYNNHLSERIGEMTFEETTAGSLHRALQSIVKPDGSLLGTAHECRSLLVKFYDFAIQEGYIRHNIAHSIPQIGYRAPQPEAWDDEQIDVIRQSLRYWMDHVPNANQNILDIYDMTLATGCRISEILGLHWHNIALPQAPGEPAVVYIEDAVLTRGKKTNELGLPKGNKTKKLTLPQFGIDILSRRQQDGDTTGLVFRNGKGNPYHVRSLYGTAERAFALAREELGLDAPERLGFHISRKTVLTEIADLHGIEAASAQGGHSTPDVTRRHYWDQDDGKVIDFAASLERLGKSTRGDERKSG
ncbi:MAG: tyrosine-type recombinase/integrase [Yaniella sp.]|nr:tyrosine-type recombinase/integrase [Yaniella sp.]